MMHDRCRHAIVGAIDDECLRGDGAGYHPLPPPPDHIAMHKGSALRKLAADRRHYGRHVRFVSPAPIAHRTIAPGLGRVTSRFAPWRA